MKQDVQGFEAVFGSFNDIVERRSLNGSVNYVEIADINVLQVLSPPKDPPEIVYVPESKSP